LQKVVEAITSTAGGAGGAGRASGSSRGAGGRGRSAAIGRLAHLASKPDLLDAAIELWKASLLSGPTTHLANIIGNATFALTRIPTQAIAGIVGTVMRGDERTRMGEVVALTAGMIQGTAAGMRAAMAVMLNEDATFGPSPTEETQHAIAGGTFGAKGPLGAAIDYIGKGVRMPYRALSSADAFFKMLNMYMTLYSSATRATLMEGGKYWHKGFAHRVAELIKEGERVMLDPAGNSGPQPMSVQGKRVGDEAIRDGLKYTFQEKLGKFGQSLTNLRSEYRGLHLIAPFLRTPLNIFRVSLEHTPFAPLSKQFREEVKAGGHRRDMALAQVMLGSGVGMLAYLGVAAGMMTGGGDPEKDARQRRRELKIPDYGIKINGKWYEYRRMEPLGTLLGAAADAGEVAKYATQEEAEHLATMISYAFSQAVINKTYMRGINDLLNVMTDPERYGDQYIQGLAGTVVPTAIAFSAQQQDEFVRDIRVRGEDVKGLERTIAGVTNAIKARIPKSDLTPEFNRESLPVAVDSWGEKRKQDERLFPAAPIKSSVESDDPVRQEANRLRIKGAQASDKAMGVKMTGDQFQRSSEFGGKLAHDIMASIMSDGGYNSLNDHQRRAVFDEVIRESRAGGRGMVVPEMINKIIQKKLKDGGVSDAELD
jgi:hypothetical protein